MTLVTYVGHVLRSGLVRLSYEPRVIRAGVW